jgi:hypothetical protein
MWSAVFRVFNGFMAFIYIGIGVLLIAAKPLFDNFPAIAQPLFGIVIIIYGCFRFYRLFLEMWKEHKALTDDTYKEENGE